MVIWHCVDVYTPRDDETRRRIAFAQSTWQVLYEAGWRAAYHISPSPRRTAASVLGDARDVPFLKDVFQAGLDKAGSTPQGAVVYTNIDVAIVPKAAEIIPAALQRWGCCFSYRRDYDRFGEHLKLADLGTLDSYPGADLFAFTPAWWNEWGVTIPDLLIGYEGWDHVVKRMMERSGFDPKAMPPVIYHETHDAFWKAHIRSVPGQAYNRHLCERWARHYGFAADLNKKPPFLF